MSGVPSAACASGAPKSPIGAHWWGAKFGRSPGFSLRAAQRELTIVESCRYHHQQLESLMGANDGNVNNGNFTAQ